MGSSPLSYSYGPNSSKHCDKEWQKPIRYVTIHSQDRRGAASKSKSPILCLNRGPIRYTEFIRLNAADGSKRRHRINAAPFQKTAATIRRG